MNKTLKLAFTAALLAGLALAGAAQATSVMVEKNHTLRIALSAPAGSVIVANPDIADVNVIDSRTVYIIGRGFGSSSVTITGRDGHALFDGTVMVTSAQTGAITVYKGLKPTLMVCSNVCISEDADAATALPPGAPGGIAQIGPTVGQGAASVGGVMGAAGGATAMQVQ